MGKLVRFGVSLDEDLLEPLYAQPVPVTVQVWEIRRGTP